MSAIDEILSRHAGAQRPKPHRSQMHLDETQGEVFGPISLAVPATTYTEPRTLAESGQNGGRPPLVSMPLFFSGDDRNERLLTAHEVAAYLYVSERWVRDHTFRRSPRLRGVKLGTLVRYRWIDVLAFVEELSAESRRRGNSPRYKGFVLHDQVKKQIGEL